MSTVEIGNMRRKGNSCREERILSASKRPAWDGVFFFVFFLKQANDLAWISRGENARRNISDHHASCADDHIIANGNTGQNRDASAKPHVISHGDRLVNLISLSAHLGIQRVIILLNHCNHLIRILSTRIRQNPFGNKFVIPEYFFNSCVCPVADTRSA